MTKGSILNIFQPDALIPHHLQNSSFKNASPSTNKKTGKPPSELSLPVPT